MNVAQPNCQCSRQRVVRALRTAVMTAFVWCGLVTTVASAQSADQPPLYVDDSPEAWELFRRARDQIGARNIAEAARLYRKLLLEFPRRLIPAPGDDPDLHVTVRTRVHSELLSNPDLFSAFSQLESFPEVSQDEPADLSDYYLSDFYSAQGLESSLRLAQADVLAGKFLAAQSLLDEIMRHPMLDGTARRRVLSLAAVIAAYSPKDAKSFNDLMQTARSTLDRETADRLLDLASTVEKRWISQDWSLLHYDPLQVSLSKTTEAPVWRFRAREQREFLLRGVDLRPQSTSIAADRTDGTDYNALTGLPVIVDDLILLAQSSDVFAVDRYDGTLRWRFPSVSDPPEEVDGSGYNPYDWADNGPTSVVIVGNTAVAALKINDQDGPDGSGQSAVYCLDLAAGSVRWTTPASALGPDFAFARFGGTPTAVEGIIVCTLQKRDQSLAGDFLVALDPADGSILWSQHVVSRGVQTWNAIPSTPLVADGCDVLFASSLGAICRVDTATGQIRWLRRLSSDLADATFNDSQRLPWEFQVPVLSRGSLYVMSSDRRVVRVLDPSDGSLRSAFPSIQWGSPDYLLPTADALLAIGPGIQRVDPANLEGQPTVLFSSEEQSPIFGRVLISTDNVLVPTMRDIRVIDSRNGKESHRVPVSAPGVPVVFEDELVVCNLAGMDSYLPYEVGEPQLRTRMARNPGDASAPISLANLAFRHTRWLAIIPAVDQALEVIARDPLTRRNRDAASRLFATLLQMGQHEAVSANGLGDEVFSRLASLVATPQNRLTYLFAFAEYLDRTGSAIRAVDQYQSILSDDALASEFWMDGGRSIRAGLECARRIRDLAQRHGWSVFDYYEHQAAEQFDAASRTLDEASLSLILRRYPTSQSAARAALLAARINRQAGRVDRAAHALRSGLAARTDAPERPELLGELVSLLQAQGLPEAALAELDAAERVAPTDTLLLPGRGLLQLSEMRREIVLLLSQQRRLPDVGPIAPNTPFRILPADEMLVPLTGRAHPELLITRTGRTLTALAGPDLAARWTVELSSPRVMMLAIHGQDAVLLVDHGEERFVNLVNLIDGRLRWTSPDIDSLLSSTGVPASAHGEDEPYGFPAAARRLTTYVTPSEILVANEVGQALCLERASGQSRWITLLPMNVLEQIEQTSFGFIFSGRRRENTRSRSWSGCVLRLSPEDGSILSDLDLGPDESPAWMAAGGDGELLLGTTSGVHCYDFAIEEVRWTLRESRWTQSQRGYVAHQNVFVRLRDDRMAIVELLHGSEISPDQARLALHPNASGDEFHVLPDVILYKQQGGVFTFDHDGAIKGRIVGSGTEDLDIQGAAPCAARIIVHETRTMQPQPGAAERRAIVYAIDFSGRRIGSEFEIVPPTAEGDGDAGRLDFGPPEHLQCIDGWILLGVNNAVIALHAPVSE